MLYREQIKKAQVRQKKLYDMHAKEPAYKSRGKGDGIHAY